MLYKLNISCLCHEKLNYFEIFQLCFRIKNPKGGKNIKKRRNKLISTMRRSNFKHQYWGINKCSILYSNPCAEESVFTCWRILSATAWGVHTSADTQCFSPSTREKSDLQTRAEEQLLQHRKRGAGWLHRRSRTVTSADQK